MARYQYAIGATQEGMQYLFELGIPAPKNSFTPFREVVSAGNGTVIGQGWGEEEWAWGFLSDTQRGVLKNLCAGLSAYVYIRTYNDSLATPAWKDYRAIMLWTPGAEERDNDHRLKFGLVFRLIEDVTA